MENASKNLRNFGVDLLGNQQAPNSRSDLRLTCSVISDLNMHLQIYLAIYLEMTREQPRRDFGLHEHPSRSLYQHEIQKLIARLPMKRLTEKLRVHASLSALLIAIWFFGSTVTASAQSFTVNNLTADVPGVAANTDPNLIGPVGLSRGIIGKWWVPNSGSATSTLYDGNGVASTLIVSLPPVPGSSTPTRATGTVFTGAAGFNVSPGNPALFMFVTLDGTILGWNPNVDLFNAVVLVNRNGKASYTGMTTAEIGTSHYLYAVNALTASIEVFDTTLQNAGFQRRCISRTGSSRWLGAVQRAEYRQRHCRHLSSGCAKWRQRSAGLGRNI